MSGAFLRWFVGGLALSVTLCGGLASAQTVTTSSSAAEETFSLLSPKPISTYNPLLKPNRDYTGEPLGDWMLYPSLLAGAIFDSDPLQSPASIHSAVGTRLHPAIVADHESGAQKTSIYGNADARIYPDLSSGDAVDAQAGFTHVWEAQRDLTFKAQGEYDRRTYLTNGGQLLTPTGGVGTLVAPQLSDQFKGSVAVEKDFDHLFVAMSATLAKTTYADLDTTGGTISQNYRDSFVTSVAGRGGYWFSPAGYVFMEAAGNIRDFSDAAYDSQGYRVTAGLGSNRIGLFRGEIYAGYQQQMFDTPLYGSTAAPVFGGKVYWYPTRALTISAVLDETFSDSSDPTPTNPSGFAAEITSARLNAFYQMAKSWSISWRGGVDHSAYLGSVRVDQSWVTGTTFNYEINRNMNLIFDYNFTRVNSNAASSSYSRNTLSLGGAYRY